MIWLPLYNYLQLGAGLKQRLHFQQSRSGVVPHLDVCLLLHTGSSEMELKNPRPADKPPNKKSFVDVVCLQSMSADIYPYSMQSAQIHIFLSTPK